MRFLLFFILWLPLLASGSDVINNKIYIDDFSIAPGEEKEIEVKMSNLIDIAGFSVEICLPDGLSFLQKNGEYVTKKSRLGNLTISPSYHENDGNQTLLVLAYDFSLSSVEIGDGAILAIYIKADENLTTDKVIYCKNTEFTSSDWEGILVSDTECHVSVCRTASLADVVAGGIEAKYMISDKLLVVAAAADQGILFCKDDNASASKTSKNEGQVDYMRDVVNEQKSEWDQSNWVALQFSDPNEENGISKMLSDAVGSYIKANTVMGVLSDINNYTITMSSDELQLEDEAPENAYSKNVYCIANFEPSNLNINGGQGAAGNYHGQDAYYFFMNPKVMEVCEITYAEWDGEKFVVPTNPARITGHVIVDWSYNEGGPQSPTENGCYIFDAVVRRTEGSSYLRDDSTDPIVVYPLNFTSDGSELPTAINDVFAGNGVVKSVKYFNVAGIESDTPFQGVNIVVTEYTDGTRTTAKMLRE